MHPILKDILTLLEACEINYAAFHRQLKMSRNKQELHLALFCLQQVNLLNQKNFNLFH
jgi:hypothetical protein